MLCIATWHCLKQRSTIWNQLSPHMFSAFIKCLSSQKSLIRDKNSLRYKNCSCKWQDVALSREYKMLCKRVGTEIKNSRVKYEVKLLKKAEKNPKIFFKYLRLIVFLFFYRSKFSVRSILNKKGRRTTFFTN